MGPMGKRRGVLHVERKVPPRGALRVQRLLGIPHGRGNKCGGVSRDTMWTGGIGPRVRPKPGIGGDSPSKGLPAEREPRVGRITQGRVAHRGKRGGGDGKERALVGGVCPER